MSRPLPLPGLYSAHGSCVRCGSALPSSVRSGLAAYFCEGCWTRVEARVDDPALRVQRAFGRAEDD